MNAARFVAVLWAGCFAGQAWAAPTEYDVKAAFLLRFANFVEWPTSAFPDANAPFVIGVLGEDPFGAALDQVVQGEVLHNHKIIVKRSQRLDDLKPCHLLFVSVSERAQVGQILDAVNNASILTVSEFAGFAKGGGMINFYISEGKVRFEINPSAADHRGLKVSARLLQVAKIVE